MDAGASLARLHEAARTAVLIAALLGASAAAAQATSYRVTDLGRADASSFGVFLNDAGQATGTFLNEAGASRAFFYSNGTRIDIGTLPGSNFTSAGGINGHGHITGSSGPAFIWRSGSGMQDIGTIGGSFAFGAGINDAGHVAGLSNAAFDENTVAVRHTPATGMQFIGQLGGQFSFAFAINNLGQITGTTDTDALSPVAFRWSESTGMVAIDDMAIGRAINDRGQIAGTGFGQAALFTPGTGTQPLGTLSGDSFSTGLGINEAGHVVGRSGAPPSPEPPQGSAFLYTQGTGMVSLNDLLDPVTGEGWELDVAHDINNRGQITGIGTFNGETRAFLLTPSQCPKPRGMLARIGLG